MNLKGTKTEANLAAAYAGESQARNKYTFYAAEAKKQGFKQIGEIFEKTADNERAHAEIWFEYLSGGSLGNTAHNLIDAATGENFEWTEMYAKFAEDARSEGLTEIAYLFEAVGKIEKDHEERFRKLAENVQQNEVFQKPETQCWICSNCGHIHEGTEAPKVCPVCKHQQSYFEIKTENN